MSIWQILFLVVGAYLVVGTAVAMACARFLPKTSTFHVSDAGDAVSCLFTWPAALFVWVGRLWLKLVGV